MPVIIQLQDIDRLLAEPNLALLKPFAGQMRSYPLSKAVNSPKKDRPELIELLPIP